MKNHAMLGILALTVSLGGAISVSGCKISDDPAAPSPVVSIAPASAQTVSSYFSVYAYGPTKVKYDVPGEKAVLLLEFPNQSKTITGTGKLFVFSEATSEEKIQAWWNNQHSDALFPDAAEPEKTLTLGHRLEIVSADMTGTERPRPDQSYDAFRVAFRVGAIETDRFTLKGFEDETTVHVMMEGMRP